MQLSEELVTTILTTLDEHPHNFMLVTDLAEKVKHLEKSGSLSDDFTNHLLHLQDLACFVNAEGFPSFGHNAKTDRSTKEGFTHCFNDQLIRINAHGRELLDILNSDNITDKGKASALRMGGEVIQSLLVKAFSGEFIT